MLKGRIDGVIGASMRTWPCPHTGAAIYLWTFELGGPRRRQNRKSVL